MEKNLVVLICPPGDVYPEAVRGPAMVPANGILTLASSVKSLENIHPIFLNDTVCPLTDILEFISLHKYEILAIGMNVLSESYKTGLTILAHARHENPGIVHLMGNDHFSASSSLCMQKRAHLIDYGPAGNEVFGSLRQLLGDISAERPVRPKRVPGLVFRDRKHIVHIPQRPEPLLTEVDYTFIDEIFSHSPCYDAILNDCHKKVKR